MTDDERQEWETGIESDQIEQKAWEALVTILGAMGLGALLILAWTWAA